MKKINLLIIAMVALTTVFTTSCNKDDENFAAPTITFENGNQTVVKNSDVVISGTILAPGEIKQIVYFKGNASYGDAVTNGFDTDTSTNFSVTIPGAEVTETFTFEVQVTDKQDKIGKASVTVTVDDVIVKADAVKVFCAPADQFGNEEFASLTTFNTYTWAQASGDANIIADIDLCYYNGNYTKTNGVPHFVSPDATPNGAIVINSGERLAGAKTTYFKILDATEAADFSDWTNVSDDVAIDAITGITDLNVAFQTGDIVAFQLADGRKGVIKPYDAVDGNNDGNFYGINDYITFDVIVQKQAPAVK